MSESREIMESQQRFTLHKEDSLTRKELIIKIPVNTRNIRLFNCQSGEFSCENTAEKIYQFLKVNLVKFNLNKNIFSRFRVSELVENSYDAYAGSKLKNWENEKYLVLKVVISKKDTTVYVKFKDNGPGFNDIPEGQQIGQNLGFQTSFNYSMKPWVAGYFGGYRKGLNCVANEIKEKKGLVTIKNRKDGDGAAVYSIFKIDESKAEAPEFTASCGRCIIS